MSFKEKFIQVLDQSQHPEHCHKKLLKIVEKYFKETDLETFTNVYISTLHRVYLTEPADQNPYVARNMEFLAKVAVKITLLCVQPTEIENGDGTTSNVFDISTDPFFNDLLRASLKFAATSKFEVKFNTCYFITLLLQNMGNNVEIDNGLFDSISESLIEPLNDGKRKVRLQAINALLRVQDPSNPDCVVMNLFLKLFSDPNAEVRKAVVSAIAPNAQSYSKIRERLADTDMKVRQAAYLRWADINPRIALKIVDRNFILSSAFDNEDKKVKQILVGKLLPKWLNFYEGNYLNFLKALKLDGDENDFIKFEKLCRKLIDVFLSMNSLADVINGLPIDKNDKLIPVKQLNLESVLYWSNLITFLRKREDADDYLDSILPELTPFSDYIERVIKEKSSVSMDEWENINYQNIVMYLFNIASGFDFTDEVGRKKFYSLIIQILTTYRFQQKVTEKIISVAALLNTNIDTFTIDMCQVISEIREPLTEERLSEEEIRRRNLEMASMNLRVHELEITEEDALAKKDFELAKITCNEISDVQRKLQSMKASLTVSEKVRTSKDDPETYCRCLDILISVLKLGKITMTPALRICRDEFLMPLYRNNFSDIHWRFILCLGLFSLMDKETALQHANFICLPIATYTTVLNYDKAALKTSVACITDLIRVHGLSVLGIDEDSASVSSQEQKNQRRKLYSENMDLGRAVKPNELSIEFILDIILDMLDDEDERVRSAAASSISKIMVHSFPADPELVSRLILKYFNPLTGKKDSKLQQQIGLIIKSFTINVKGAKKIIAKAILSIISSITSAPAGSPLLEIDMNNLLRFLSALISLEGDENSQNIHNNLATTVIEKISNNPTDDSVPHLTKLLTHLDVHFDDSDVQRTVITSIEFVLTDLSVESRKNVLKFISTLRKNQPNICNKDQSTTINGTHTTMESSSATLNSLGRNSNGAETGISIPSTSKTEIHENPVARKRRLRPTEDTMNNAYSKRGNSPKTKESKDVTNDKNDGKSRESLRERNQLSLKNLERETPVIPTDKVRRNKPVLAKVQEESAESSDDSRKEQDVPNTNNVFVKCDYTHLKTIEKETQKNNSGNNGIKPRLDKKGELFNANSEKNHIRIVSQVIIQNAQSSGTKGKKKSSSDVADHSDKTPIRLESPNRLKKRAKSLTVVLTPLSTPPAFGAKERTALSDRIPSKKRPAFTPLSAKNPRIFKKSPRLHLAVSTSREKLKELQKQGNDLRKSGPLNNTPKKRQLQSPNTQSKENAEINLRRSVRKNAQLNKTPSRKRQTESPYTAIRQKPSKKPKMVNDDNREKVKNKLDESTPTKSMSVKENMRKLSNQRTSSRILAKRRSKINFSPAKTARNLRTRSLRKSLYLQGNKKYEESDDESSESSENENDKSSSRSKKKETGDEKKKKRLRKNTGLTMREQDISIRLKRSIRKLNDRDLRTLRRSNQPTTSKDDTDKKNVSKKKGEETKTAEKTPLNLRDLNNSVESTRSSRSKTKRTSEPPKIDKINVKIGESSKIRAKDEDNDLKSPSSNKLRLSNKDKKRKNAEELRANNKDVIDNSQKKELKTSSRENKTSPRTLRSKKSDPKCRDNVLKSLNNVLNEENGTPTKESKIKNMLNGSMRIRSRNKMNGSISNKSTQKTHHTSNRTSRYAATSGNKSSRRQLEFSSAAEETILKTFLQGDEKFEDLEEFVIEDVSSSNSSNDSKKENLLLNTSSTSCSSSYQEIRTSNRRRTKNIDSFYSDSDSSPLRKVSKTDKNSKLNGIRKTKLRGG